MANLTRALRCLGFRFIPENHRAPVFRLGMYQRMCGPGYVWVIPGLERLGPDIFAGFRAETLVFNEVFSADQMPFQVETTVRFAFRPEGCSSRQVAAYMVRISTQALANLVRDFTEEAVRNTLAHFLADDLFQRRCIARVTGRITRLLGDRLRPRGLCLLTDGGVIIKQMRPPETHRRTSLTVDHLRKVMEVMAEQSTGIVDRALTAHFISALVESNLEALSLGEAARFPVKYGYIGGNGFQRTMDSGRKLAQQR